MDRDYRQKFWLAILAIFVFGALTSNAAWLIYTNVKDARFEERITSVERSYEYQLGEQRTRIERKIDIVIEELRKAPPSPVIIDVQRKLEAAKSDD